MRHRLDPAAGSFARSFIVGRARHTKVFWRSKQHMACKRAFETRSIHWPSNGLPAPRIKSHALLPRTDSIEQCRWRAPIRAFCSISRPYGCPVSQNHPIPPRHSIAPLNIWIRPLVEREFRRLCLSLANLSIIRDARLRNFRFDGFLLMRIEIFRATSTRRRICR